MAKYSSKPVDVAVSANEVFEKVSHIGSLQEKLDSLPADLRAKVGEVKFTDDTITITAQPVGDMTFQVVERMAPGAGKGAVVLAAQQSPVPLSLSINISPEAQTPTQVSADIDVDIPAMLRPLVGGKMQEAADKFGELLATFFNQSH